jgi:hypothetical protein
LKKVLLIPVLVLIHVVVLAQKIDSIYFNLYTDSLKKGSFNYINVEGKLPGGSIRPLDSTQLIFSASYGKFQGNSLWLPFETTEDKINITVTSRQHPALSISRIIFIKKKGDDEKLKSVNDIINESPKKSRRKTT